MKKIIITKMYWL